MLLDHSHVRGSMTGSQSGPVVAEHSAPRPSTQARKNLDLPRSSLSLDCSGIRKRSMPTQATGRTSIT